MDNPINSGDSITNKKKGNYTLPSDNPINSGDSITNKTDGNYTLPSDGGTPFNVNPSPSSKELTLQDIEGFFNKGLRQGELGVGATLEEIGAGRRDIRSQLEKIQGGNSVASNRMKASQNSRMRDLKANQRMQGGGGQINAAQAQDLQRQQDRDLADFTATEERQTLSDRSREYRGAGADMLKPASDWAALLTASKTPAQADDYREGDGVLTQLLGGLF